METQGALLYGIVRYESNVRSSADRRCMVSRILASYRDWQGREWRREFEGPRDSRPSVPGSIRVPKQ